MLLFSTRPSPSRSDMGPRGLGARLGTAKGNGCSTTKLTMRSTKWPPSSMKGAIFYLPNGILAYRGYAKVILRELFVTERWEAGKAVDVYINGRHSAAYRAYTLSA